MSEQDCILIIDSSEDVTIPLQNYFAAQQAEIIVTADPTQALVDATTHAPQIILLGASVGTTDGLDLFRKLRGRPRTAHIPIMFIVGFNDLVRQNELLAAGADDVIARPFDVEILGLRVRNAIQRSRREGLTDGVTGLPTGNLLVERTQQLAAQPGWCALNVQIAHFDAFRARYDFITGNEVLRYAGNAILELVETTGEQDAYAGYQTAQTFVVLVPCTHVETLTAAFQTRLQDALQQFYTFMERDQGFVEVEDGSGGTRQHPLMQILVSQTAPSA